MAIETSQNRVSLTPQAFGIGVASALLGVARQTLNARAKSGEISRLEDGRFARSVLERHLRRRITAADIFAAQQRARAEHYRQPQHQEEQFDASA